MDEEKTIISSLLTLNMLNCFKDYKRCIHISYHILGCIRQKKTKFTMEQPCICLSYIVNTMPADALVT